MLFLSDSKNPKNTIINKKKEIISDKISLENLYCKSNYSDKKHEIVEFVNLLIKKSENTLLEENIDKIYNESCSLIDFVNSFVEANLDFVDQECQRFFNNYLYSTIALGGILSGVLQIEKSHYINETLSSIKIAYDGVDRIATAVEHYISFIPEDLLVKVIDALEDISKNTQEHEKHLEVFHGGNKVLFLNNFTAMKRACNSTIYHIKNYLHKKEKIEETISLYPDKEAYEFIEKQKKDFKNYDKSILSKFKDKFVYFENNEILDSDYDEETLIERVMKRVGYRSAFITKL